VRHAPELKGISPCIASLLFLLCAFWSLVGFGYVMRLEGIEL
jgi:hypothetical protein